MSDEIRVLHVDDDPSIADLTTTFLTRKNDRFAVETATSADDGLSRIDERPPDCVVSDYDMPGMDGLEFLQAVREEYPDLPFILYTGKGSEEVAGDAIAANVTDYLQKKSGSEQYTLLANRIQNAVRARRDAERATRQEELMRLTEFAGDTGGFELDRESDTILLTAGTRRIIGRSDQHEISLQEAIELYHPDDREDIQQSLNKAFETGEELHKTWRLQPGNGDERLLDLTIRPVFENGEVTKLRGAGHDITERKEFEQQLRRNDRRFEALFNDPNLLVGLLELDGTLIDVNETAMEYIDGDRDAVINEPFWTTPWWPAEMQPRIREKIEQAAIGRYVEYNADLVQSDGDQYSVTGMIRPVTNESGDVTSLIVSARDVTERVRRERILDAILEHTTVPMFMKNKDGEYILVNQGFRNLFGLNDTEVRGHTDEDLFDPEMVTEVRQNDNRVLETGESVETEERIIVNGEGRIYLSSKTPIYEIGTDSDPDDPVAIFGVASDITERKEREQKLELVETLFENAQECLFIVEVVDGEFKLRHANDYYKRTVGLSLGEPVTGQTPTELFGDTGGQEILNRYGECVETRESVTYTVEVPVPEEGTVYRTILAPVVTGDEVTYIVGTARDITDHKHREEKLKRQNNRL